MSEGNGCAIKDALLGGFKRRWKVVPSGIGPMTLGSVSEGEHQQIEKEIDKLNKRNDANIRLVYLKWGCWLPDKSARMFNDSEIKEMVSNGVDFAIVRNLVDAIYKHFGLAKEDIEELIKNSPETGEPATASG